MNLLRGVITGMLKEIGSPENQTFYTKVSPHAHIKLPFRFKKKTRTVITWNQCVLKGKFESRSFKELKQKTIFRKKKFSFLNGQIHLLIINIYMKKIPGPPKAYRSTELC